MCNFDEDDEENDFHLSTTASDEIYFHIHDIDVDDTVVVIQLLVNCTETDPTSFSLGFFIINLKNYENKAYLINESPRILMSEEGDYYLTDRKIITKTELIFSIDTKSNLIPVNQIVSENTIYCLRELMPFLNFKFDESIERELKVIEVEEPNELLAQQASQNAILEWK